MKYRDTDFALELEFTDTHEKYEGRHRALREAACLAVQFPAVMLPIRDGDLYAGLTANPPVGFTPETAGRDGFTWYCDEEAVRKKLSLHPQDPAAVSRIEAMLGYWKPRTTKARLKAAYTVAMRETLPTDDYEHESAAAFPLYRIAGTFLDYGKLLSLGIPGLRKLAEAGMKRAKEAEDADGDAVLPGDTVFLESCLLALDTLGAVCLSYAGEADGRAAEERVRGNTKRAAELEAMSKTLRSITDRAPNTLHEAIQLLWLYALVSGSVNYGRLDDVLGPFLASDLGSGRLSEPGALALLRSFWKLIADRKITYNSRVVIGGRGRKHEAEADAFALLAMEATRTVLETEPQLTLRFHRDQNPALYRKALDVIAEGRTYPMLYNDDVNIRAVSSALGVPPEEAERYLPFGCGEYVLDHGSIGTPSGIVNLAKALELALHDGVDPFTGRIAGLRTGAPSDYGSFDALLDAYRAQVEHFVAVLADQEALEYRIAGGEACFLYLSMLYDDCLSRGLPLLSGGVRYAGGTIESYGNTNAADSLTAIRKLVYERNAMSLPRLVSILDADFEGFERERRLLLEAPKYGNDDGEADSMLCEIHAHVCNAARSQASRVGLHSYLVVVINNNTNTTWGRTTAASADGRKSGEPLANGNNPSGGRDRKGVTAFLNSLVKPDPSIHAGAVQNMKFSRSLFTGHRRVLEQLLAVYFRNGGTQAMITVTDREELERAYEHPEMYGHLFVRVGGFSARFVTLGRDVQREVISRTLY